MIYRLRIEMSLLVNGDENCADVNAVYQDLKECLLTQMDSSGFQLEKRNRCLEEIRIKQEKLP